ncbi:PAS domain-containing protein [Pseudomonas sp. 148P]|uniref:PAS domain-containing protein n=1 Tax=Pseudomonas ulcerans TaxID=3115852 RepID=A0ABU7HNL2_9PSED|nr:MULTISPECIES: PAS domain-containing protein [unclassified Pseudomonas]MEE1923611.1 PAS domain-containing protein [Pseudomonas sp. 147P]MEE1933109.1 PAS domain-containing protein [Pseudomonas sp. 148P]
MPERQLVLDVLHATVRMLGTVLGRNTEVVLHDLTRPEHSVLAIVNGHLSGRQVGSPILAGPRHDRGFDAVLHAALEKHSQTPVVIGNYPTLGHDGKAFRSATAVFRDSSGEPFASLCVNTDLSGIAAAQACLEQLLATAEEPVPAPRESPDLEQLMTRIIDGSLQDARRQGVRFGKAQKLDAVRQMHDGGLFIVKGAVEKAAAALGVSRYTIYNYLEEIRNG